MSASPGSSLTLDARRARRLLLAQAVDEVDTQGRLLSEVEREQIERMALHEVAGPHPAHAPDAERYLDERARRVLETVDKRDPRIAALQRSEPWQRWLGWGLPALALMAGLLLERIDNPGQVNMLSPPLLAFLLWNVVVYLVLLLRPLWARRRGAGPGGLASAVRDWLGHRSPPRSGRNLRGAVATRFRLHWWRVAGALEGWRIAQILHLSAAAWAVGVGLSIVIGGLVREYRVGWESTLLDLPQVHALLSVLFAPVVAVLPVEAFTLEQVERMHFRSGAAVGQAEARHWITLYLGLLALLVVVPRVLLALWSAARRRWLARALRIDLGERYFTEVLARVSPARMVLAWTAGQASARELMRRLWSEAGAQWQDGARVQPLQTGRGDELVVWEAPPLAAPVPPGEGGEAVGAGRPEVSAPVAPREEAAATPTRLPARWLGRLQAWWEPVRLAPVPIAQAAEADLWLVAVGAAGQLSALLPQLQRLPRPVLLLDASGDAEETQALQHLAESARLPFEWLDLHASAGCWAWEEPLRAAIARHLPLYKAAGAQRLLQAWQARHEERLQQAMRVLADPLLQAAREAQDLGSGPLSLRRLVHTGDREAGHLAREQAMATLLGRLAQAQEGSWMQLRSLYGLAATAAPPRSAGPDERFVVRQGIDAPQAGMAGAASGAAAGVGIDLITGGLSLGAGAALGALVGGGAALVAAAFKNRSAPGGATQVQLSEDMLQALCELALLQYLAVALREGEATGGEVPAAWRSEVVAAVERHRTALQRIWDKARAPGGPETTLPGALSGQLEAMARELLARLRPV